MEVFVIPIASDRYELYCEVPVEAAEVEPPEASSGWFAGMRTRFATMLREAEDRQRHDEEPGGLWERLQHRLFAWVAERIAEQRLLWNMRRETGAGLVYPSDMTFDDAVALVTRILRRDHDRHRVWLAVHTVLFVLSGVLFFVPGPNLVAYYFAFRAFGHLLSMRGAAQGLHRIAWSGTPHPRLVDLRGEVARARGPRHEALDAIAGDLHLANLTAFVERLTPR